MAKSTDGGNTWSSLVSLMDATTVRDVKVDVTGPREIVFVATDIGLFRSTDDGATYSQITGGRGEAFENKNFWSLVKTSVGWLASAEDSGFVAYGPGSLYYSTDLGATWAAIPNAGNGYNSAGRTTLGVASAADSVAYAFAADVTGSTQRDLRPNWGLYTQKRSIWASGPEV